jgi:segregation and condensation protein A
MPDSAPAKKQDVVHALGVFSPPPIDVECEAFTGSLGALFEVVKRQKVELLDVPLAPICEAYYRYLIDNAQSDLESASVALAALAYLLERKAWLLLPTKEDEPDEDDILEQIEPYANEYDAAILALEQKRREGDLRFYRGTGQEEAGYELPFEADDISVEDLALVFQKLMERAQPDPVEPLSKPRRSLSEQMTIVLKELSEEFQPLEELVTGEFTRSEVVWWFLALLELIRLGQAQVRKHENSVEFARGVSS